MNYSLASTLLFERPDLLPHLQYFYDKQRSDSQEDEEVSSPGDDLPISLNPVYKYFNGIKRRRGNKKGKGNEWKTEGNRKGANK